VDLTASRPVEDLRLLYIDLLKRALLHTLYWPPDIGVVMSSGEQLSDEQIRASGHDWPEWAQTMIGACRLDNVQYCVESVLCDEVPGDFIETGVWRGGAVIFMRGLLRAWGDPPDRIVFVADSFEGLPPANIAKYPADAHFDYSGKPERERRLAEKVRAQLAVTQEDVERNFALYDLLDDRVRFLPGWFKDTLPKLHDRTWAVIRLDGDLYESTMDTLVNLYPRLVAGGFLIVDDYVIPACRKAVDDYREAHGITEPIVTIDQNGIYWRRHQ
jgi:hypothetical protein